jgi:CheY-like chemotaxis protein
VWRLGGIETPSDFADTVLFRLKTPAAAVPRGARRAWLVGAAAGLAVLAVAFAGLRFFGEKALALARDPDIAVVLLDVQMPGMDGLETLRKLLEANPRLAVVMATGDHGDDKVKKALALGARAYVLKPFDFAYLELEVLSRLRPAADGPPDGAA